MAVNVKSLNRDQTSSLYAFLRMTVQAMNATTTATMPETRATIMLPMEPSAGRKNSRARKPGQPPTT